MNSNNLPSPRADTGTGEERGIYVLPHYQEMNNKVEPKISGVKKMKRQDD